MLIDTHVHFDCMTESGAPDAIIARAAEHGVEKMVAVGGSAEGNAVALQVARVHPGRVRAALGFDRGQFGAPHAVAEFEKQLAQKNAAAIGEVGLDFHHGRSDCEAQTILFNDMLAVARRHALPVIVHNREAEDDMLAILADHAGRWPGRGDRIGVLHCFTGSSSLALRFVELGFHISFSGILTFHPPGADNELAKAARAVPDDRLLVETDSPFLAPVPVRGRPNEPANVRYVAKTLAEIRGCTVDQVSSITTRNAEDLFFK